MTAQIHDVFILRDVRFELTEISGEGLFEPEKHGINLECLSSACWRGYHACYGLHENQIWLQDLTVGFAPEDVAAVRMGQRGRLFGKSPHYHERPHGWVYSGLNHPVDFTGGLLLGEGFIGELYVHMGFHPAWKYRVVKELIFKSGKLLS